MNILRNAALAFVLFASFSTARAADAIPIQDGTALARLVAEASETKAATAITPQALGGVNTHIPSWLRLHHRRNHTAAARAAAPSDPTGRYTSDVIEAPAADGFDQATKGDPAARRSGATADL